MLCVVVSSLFLVWIPGCWEDGPLNRATVAQGREWQMWHTGWLEKWETWSGFDPNRLCDLQQYYVLEVSFSIKRRGWPGCLLGFFQLWLLIPYFMTTLNMTMSCFVLPLCSWSVKFGYIRTSWIHSLLFFCRVFLCHMYSCVTNVYMLFHYFCGPFALSLSINRNK